jgi:hypothetical protein
MASGQAVSTRRRLMNNSIKYNELAQEFSDGFGLRRVEMPGITPHRFD